MGYTHYWTYRRDGDQAEWARAITTASRVLTDPGCELDTEYADNSLHVNGAGPCDGGRNHCDPKSNGYGCRDAADGAAHETFILYTVLSSLPNNPSWSDTAPSQFWDFCKTAQKSYDVPVSAMLAIVAHLAPSCIEVESDGDLEDWESGLALASRIAGFEIPAPASVCALAVS